VKWIKYYKKYLELKKISVKKECKIMDFFLSKKEMNS